MAYAITEGNNNLNASLESFLFYMPFQVHVNTGIVEAHQGANGYFAYHVGWTSTQDFTSRPLHPQRPGAAGMVQNYTIREAGGQGNITIKSARLKESRYEVRSNELSCLHLFELSANLAVGSRKWLDLAQWAYTPPAPRENEDGTGFAPAGISFGGLEAQHLFKYMEYHVNGWKQALFMMPFKQNGAFSTILDAWDNNAPIPSVSISPLGQGNRPTVRFFQNYVANIAPTGFVMVAQGAFKAMATSSLKEWSGRNLDANNVMAMCEECVNNAVGQETRNQHIVTSTLESSDSSRMNSIPLASVDGPLEVLFLEDMPDGAPFMT